MLKPYMPQQEIAVMDAIFALKRPKRVLEYGAGGSTVRWSRLPYVERWDAVEHDPDWYAVVAGATLKANIVKGSADDPEGYVTPPGLRPPYDLIFVDGIFRVECVRNAPEYLTEHGVLVLHDASRTHYRECWDALPNLVHLTRGDGLRDGLMVMWR